jgi:hypothetical protein
MVFFHNADDAIAAFDRFCEFAIDMLEDPAAIQRVASLKGANLSYDQRRFPMSDPNHYHRALHTQLAKVLGPQRYNLLSEGYHRIYLAPHRVAERARTQSFRRVENDPVDIASIRYRYRQAIERDELRAPDASR